MLDVTVADLQSGQPICVLSARVTTSETLRVLLPDGSSLPKADVERLDTKAKNEALRHDLDRRAREAASLLLDRATTAPG